jgi:hypothetical protein
MTDKYRANIRGGRAGQRDREWDAAARPRVGWRAPTSTAEGPTRPASPAATSQAMLIEITAVAAKETIRPAANGSTPSAITARDAK